METVLTVRNLTKQIGGELLVDGVSFECRKGEIFGLLGPGGAGKNALLGMLSGLIEPDGGEINICGYSLLREHGDAMRLVGAAIGSAQPYLFMTGRQNLRQTARAYGKIDEQKLADIVEMSKLGGAMDRKVKTYSVSMKQKLTLCRALYPHPALLILDEPANGLEPAETHELRDILKTLAHRDGLCVFLTTHLSREAASVCDRTGILSGGRFIELESAAAGGGLAKKTAYRFVVTPIDRARELLAESRIGTVLSVTERSLDVLLTSEELSALNRYFVENGVSLQTVSPVEGKSLEDIYIELTRNGGGRND